MEIVTYIMLGFAGIAALDRIIGNRLGLGESFEKGIQMLGPLTLSMAGMLVIAPWLAAGLSHLRTWFPPFLDLSILPASLIANDMGGAHLAVQLAADEAVGYFNALIVSSMMGCTLSFTLPFALQVTDRAQHRDILLGLLCGIVTIPVGCFAAGCMLGLPLCALLTDLLPLLLLACIIAILLVRFEALAIRLFTWLGILVKALITVGLFAGIVEFLTGYRLLPHADPLEEVMQIIINIVCIMAGAFPLLHLCKKLLHKGLVRLGDRLGINAVSAFGFISTVGTSVTTFEMMHDMDPKGRILNAAFIVSASFVFVDHLAFTLSFQPTYIPSLIAGKLLSGIAAVFAANLLYSKPWRRTGKTIKEGTGWNQ